MTPPRNQNAAIRREVYYSGHVQGVFFRATTKGIASKYPVTGFVRNLPDGRVEMIAEGGPAELDRFQAAIGKKMHDNIREAVVTESDPTGEFDAFSIRY